MSYTRYRILIMYIFFSQACFAQQGKMPLKASGFGNLSMNSKSTIYFKTGDSIYIVVRGICKGAQFLPSICIHTIPEELASATPAKPTFIKVHGNVLYDFSY